MERYDDALAAFHNVPGEKERVLDEQGVNIMLGRFDAAIAAIREYRAGAKAINDIFHANEFLCGLGVITGRLDLANSSLAEMVKLPAFPPLAKMLDCACFGPFVWETTAHSPPRAKLLSEIASRWPNAFTRAAESHAKALEAWRRKSFDEAEQLLLESCGSAFSVWALFDLAEFYTYAKPALAERYWSRLDDHRGTLLERWSPASLVLVSLGSAALGSQKFRRPPNRFYLFTKSSRPLGRHRPPVAYGSNGEIYSLRNTDHRKDRR